MYSESNGQRNHAIGVRIPLEGAIFFGGGGIACPIVKYIWHAVDITQI